MLLHRCSLSFLRPWSAKRDWPAAHIRTSSRRSKQTAMSPYSGAACESMRVALENMVLFRSPRVMRHRSLKVLNTLRGNPPPNFRRPCACLSFSLGSSLVLLLPATKFPLCHYKNHDKVDDFCPRCCCLSATCHCRCCFYCQSCDVPVLLTLLSLENIMELY